ncbi:Uncharacterized protein BP5553_05540 [Venustampulla echinocandica]|uniref:Peptide N-acetyl-beta-D-glucosaminyl asparaginase amidase A N-terminal domain-containing protein n=1 Tax=Venustampulla echinocandica TaxID=2656787 RepID=A0A370TRE6_9HELO|nr:Uncharacterized protein BP5553_05540 [Venustampulla echinocandica]RDL38107.1 Uncharacterized protein BP5553_05540 [Venustampulla echinocandica]
MGDSSDIKPEGSPSPITVTQALECARDSEEGARDPTIINILDTALADIRRKIDAQPTSYVMTRDEFAVFNYFQRCFEGDEVAVAARRRYWDQYNSPATPPARCLVNIGGFLDFIALIRSEVALVVLEMGTFSEKKQWFGRGIGRDRGSTLRRLEEDGHLIPTEEILASKSNNPNSEQDATRKKWAKPVAFIVVGCCIALLWVFGDCLFSGSWPEKEVSIASYSLVKDDVPAPSPPKPSDGVLECFQVHQPVLFPSGAVDQTLLSTGAENTAIIAATDIATSCQVLLMEHQFAYSYGLPFVGNYNPPKCKFNRVAMNFTVTSRGRQYDRLAIMYFNDTEVWRTSTAEPTTNGIRWEYIKDMTEYMYFWNSPQKLIFDLGNLIDDTYTGPFNTTLTATFFTVQEEADPAPLIIPISARKGATNEPSLFALPQDNATNTISFPRNANRAVFSVSACGQGTEEFWWANALQSNIHTFEPVAGTLYGYSAFREVQVLIDGQLAGVEWPFPVIFTGGVVPGLWRPIVGVDAFDLREHEIDITPWLPILCDGAEHSFEIRVVGILDNGESSGTITKTVGASWYVTGKIFIWLDDEGSVTTGRSPTVRQPQPVISLSQSLTQNSTGANETLKYTTDVKRELSISSQVKTQNGTNLVTWTQSLSVKNYGLYTAFGAVQQNNQTTTGVDQSTGGVYFKSSYSYPLYANTTYLVQPGGNFTIDAVVIRGLDLSFQGKPVFPTGIQPFAHIPRSAPLVPSFIGTTLSTLQNGSAHYFGSPSAHTSSGFGRTRQEFSFNGVSLSGNQLNKELYFRSVEAINGTLVKDYESLLGSEVASYVGKATTNQLVMGDVVSPKEAIGRGPGAPKRVLVQGGGV